MLGGGGEKYFSPFEDFILRKTKTSEIQTILLKYVYMMACVCLWALNGCLVPGETRRGVGSPGPGVTGSCKLPCWYSESNPGPLQESYLLLTTETFFFQSLNAGLSIVTHGDKKCPRYLRIGNEKLSDGLSHATCTV